MDDQIRPHEAPPGTEILIDQGKEKYEGYQHVTRGNAQILLVPQPSLIDPNDPLALALVEEVVNLREWIILRLQRCYDGSDDGWR